MDKNQQASASIFTEAHPPFLVFAVLFVRNGDGERVQNHFCRTIEADPVFSQVLLGFDRIPLKSVAQYPPVDCNK
jgi:hypothetical protein